MIFSGSSKGTHTAHNDFYKLTYIQFTSLVAYFSSFQSSYSYVFVYICCFSSPEPKAHNKDRI